MKQIQKKTLGDRFELYTAFSRQSDKKVYVQHRLVEHAAELRSLLLDNTGYLNVCGDARMAREVQSTVCELLSKESKITGSETETIIHQMKSTGRYQVFPFCFFFLLSDCRTYFCADF
jgi:NADPH-ferrihemoprotein reductase